MDRIARQGVLVLLVRRLVAWGAAASAGIDRADATGGQGSIWTGAHWLLAAVAVAAAAVRTVLRRGRPEALGG